jgi:hypothetical protein
MAETLLRKKRSSFHRVFDEKEIQHQDVIVIQDEVGQW